ncbi:IS91 family transposase [Desulfitobacterium sp. THU1]|uniref:IS91 family transposase n=1 Tax=Desulfitobacterium sp. THU1 TaxID=3138072 RepID=UPI00311EB3C5
MPELQDIFNQVRLKSMSPAQAKAFHMIRRCRTSSMGYHSEVCTECGSVDVAYNSCRNRHCPKCQHSVQEQWVEAQMAKILPVGYFHIVFTLPQELNTLVFQNQKLLYSLLLKAASHTLVELAKDPKFLGATTGVTSVLHTWGQNLSFHPHVHCIVPGGGLSTDSLRFVRSRKKFFIPVKVVSRKFRGKFLYLLRQAYDNRELAFFNNATPLSIRDNFLTLLDDLYSKEWVVFCKKPFKSPAHVVKYLGRYTHRVAISNSRIKSFDGKTVSFAWKDYKDGNKPKVMTLDASEFARRFLLHVLPDGLVKVRHYGLLSSRNIGVKLLKCMFLTGTQRKKQPPPKYTKTCCECGGSHFVTLLFPKLSCASP